MRRHKTPEQLKAWREKWEPRLVVAGFNLATSTIYSETVPAWREDKKRTELRQQAELDMHKFLYLPQLRSEWIHRTEEPVVEKKHWLDKLLSKRDRVRNG